MTLFILAAGMGSRYGGLKQIDKFTDHGEFIIDFSIYDAIEAGFDRVVFIIKEENYEIFKETVGNRVKDAVKVEYAFQDLNMCMGDHAVPEGRVKPWGTTHAVLCAREYLNEPFAVINSDDFYGRESFAAMADFLRGVEGRKGCYALVGYYLKNTLSEFGSVSRGVCGTGADGCLASVTERTSIQRKADGKVCYTEQGIDYPVSEDSVVSMNFWGFTPDYFAWSDEIFREFLDSEAEKTNLKAEYFIPYVADVLIRRGDASFRILNCDAKWFGVTYKEDRPFVVSKIEELIGQGVYPRSLWG